MNKNFGTGPVLLCALAVVGCADAPDGSCEADDSCEDDSPSNAQLVLPPAPRGFVNVHFASTPGGHIEAKVVPSNTPCSADGCVVPDGGMVWGAGIADLGYRFRTYTGCINGRGIVGNLIFTPTQETTCIANFEEAGPFRIKVKSTGPGLVSIESQDGFCFFDTCEVPSNGRVTVHAVHSDPGGAIMWDGCGSGTDATVSWKAWQDTTCTANFL